MLESITENLDPDEESAGLLTRIRRRKALFAGVFVGVLALTAAIYFILPA